MSAQLRRKVTSTRRRLPAFVLVLVVAALCIAGVIYKGAEVTQVNVNDGGIWVTNKSKQMVGHLDYEARILDGALRTEATNFDVGQAGETVTVSDLTSLTVAPVNVTQVSLGSPTALPSGSSAMQGGDVLGVLNPTDGTLWTTSATAPSPANLSEGAALSSNMGTSAFVTGLDGSVYSLAASGTLTTVKRQGTVDQAATSRIEGIPEDAQLSITVVGDQVVALDSQSNTLFLPGGKKLDLGAAGVEEGGILQLAGPKADSVLLATPSALVSIPLAGGTPTITRATESGASGNPAAPVRHEGCAYGAWSVSGAYMRACDDPSANKQMVVDTLTTARDIVFRTNRKAIVLNDVAQGSVWLPDSNMVLMDNWDEVENQLEETEEEQDSPELTNEVADPQQREQNTPPEAVDDEFGIRPGRSTVLPVLDNDSDLDGDVLTAAPTSAPEWGTISIARGGRALQISGVDANQTGSTSFSYEASDGQASASARVQVTIHPYSQNAAPNQLRASTVKIGANAQIQYQALSDWRDPDGDPIYLKNAEAPEGLSVSFSEDGSLTITDEGSAPGPKSIVLTVADDQGAETRGELIATVQEAGNLPPSANGDLFQAHPGETVTLDPLKNDTDPNGDPLSLAAVSGAPAGATISPDLDRGTIDFRATAPGSYSFAYTVSDGIATTLGIIRVEVVEATALPPVAENDTAVLPLGGSVLVAPLNNDYDPSGGLLSITSVDASNVPGLEVALIDRHLLRVTAPSGLTQTASFSYTVSNGQGEATADVMVIPGAADRSDLPPVLKPDRAKVRVGDVGTVSVLSNDRSPAGLNLQVESTLAYDPTNALGTPFVTGNQVRLEAGANPGIMDVTYSVIDSAGNRASSTVTFEVVGASDQNQPPRPRDISAWAAAGQTTRIPVTLDGIDPDGDSVSLTGLDSSPQQGSATAQSTWIDYTPNQNASGTDSFTYTVTDRQGARASARVRVAISAAPSLNQNPVAVPDTVLTRPDRMVTVNVLSNDVDPDGDPLTLEEDGLETATPELDPQVRSSSTLQVHTPSQVGTYLVSYTVSDGRGGSARGTVTVYVQDDAPLKAPIARDDYVSYEDLPTDGSAVRVKVLENDEDPDGSIDELTVTSAESGVTVDGTDLLIPVTDTLRLVVYTITDRDGLTNSAVVTVPGRDSTAPFLNAAALPIEMDAGTSRTINLSDYVVTRSGRSPRLVDGTSPVPQTGLDSVVADSSTQLTLTATATFGGNSAFLIQVADGGADDAGALSASLSLPVRIKATTNQPPTFAPTAIRVEAGGAAVTQNLALAVRDPEGTDASTFTYAMGSAPSAVSASLSGTVLTVSAPEGATPGSAGSIPVSVTDEQGNTVNASIPVEIVSTTKPRIQVPPYTVNAKVGDTVIVDVASRATNPFPDTPISLVGTAVSLGNADIASSGTSVMVTPRATGTISVGFQVNDKLGDPSRVVQGTITVTVTDKPGAPTNVVAEAVGATGAKVTFDAPASNGSPITGYRLYDSNGAKIADCPNTVCEVNGLRTGQSYRFSVSAVNEQGESARTASNEITPTGVPDRPGGPSVTPGDGELTMTWDAPNNNGSPITGYTVYATAASGSRTCTTNGERTCTISGLVNDQNYTVTVVATNANGNSQASPGVSGTPKATRRGPDQPVITSGSAVQQRDGNGALATITWSLGSSGTARWGQTIVSVNGITKTVSGGTTSTQMTVPYGVALTVYVTVSNTNGDTATSPGYVIPAVVHEDPTPPKTTPLAPDAPRLGPPSDNALGKLRVADARLKEGNGYKAADLELFYADSAAGCTAPGNPLRLNNGDRGDFNIGPLTPGATMTFYFCQRGKKDDGSYVWSPVTAATGTVGNGQRDGGGGDDDEQIPPFEVHATAGADSASASWTIPSGVTITETKVWIEGMEASTGQTIRGPLTQWWADDLQPVHEYTIIVQLTGSGGQHREVRTTVRTGELTDNIAVTLDGKMSCPNGEECGSMTLRAVNAQKFQSGLTLVCSVKTGRPASITEFRFSRDTPQITGILTEVTMAKEFLAKPPVTSCHVE
ncbi:Ig-like domain-containing protein [Pauljensenia sp. UMB3104]|uniref:Ig-like domain-containing protein n=1 Tax=Pauljensenia sp. UMB3104 TaxID=3046331 RepID=UPI0025502218|nr:Ig-like domain-containing protein [Pauljensenia sp. UMB3104]MDK7159471.1 Ig-like domain-containing protein [Pauljensenia sp. UMB3104]